MGWEGAMAPAPLSTGFQSLPPLPTIKLGPSGADSWVGGLVHTLGPCGSLQQPLLWGWKSLLLLPQPPGVFSIRGLRLYFPELEPWVTCSASLPVRPGLSVSECGAAGSASGQTACPFGPTLRQSRSRQGHLGPLRPGARLHPSYQSGCMFLFLSPWCRTSLLFDFLSVLVVQGGTVCLPTPPSWFSQHSFLSRLVPYGGPSTVVTWETLEINGFLFFLPELLVLEQSWIFSLYFFTLLSCMSLTLFGDKIMYSICLGIFFFLLCKLYSRGKWL